MTLMTPTAIRQLPLIVAAWKHAFNSGVGQGNGTATVTRVEQVLADNTVLTLYSPESRTLRKHDTQLHVPGFFSPADVSLDLQTPLRIQQRGTLIKKDALTPSIFLRHLVRRVSFQVGSQQPNALTLEDIRRLNALADTVNQGEKNMEWRDWTRYSSRQRQKMTLGGLVGQWQLLQVPSELLPFIYLGQWLHVGKETAFGLGQYKWVSRQEKHM